MPKDFGIGASSKRREDVRFLTGTGRYTDDINVYGQAYVSFVRSEVAHGKLISVNAEEAAMMPGVIRIFTGADFEGVGGLPCGWQIHDRNGEPMKEPAHPVLAQGKSSPCRRPDRGGRSGIRVSGSRRGRNRRH